MEENIIGLICILAGAIIHILIKGLSRPTRNDRNLWWRKSGRATILSTISIMILYGVACLLGYGGAKFITLFTLQGGHAIGYIILMSIGFNSQVFTKHLIQILANTSQAVQKLRKGRKS